MRYGLQDNPWHPSLDIRSCLRLSKKVVEHRKTRKRYEISNHARFLTFSCFDRKPFFADPVVADLFADRLMWTRQRLGFGLHAWVVMPEHVHLLISPKLPEAPVSKVLMSLKRPVAKDALKHMRSQGAHAESFWLPGGGYDRNIFSEQEMLEKCEYIHANPVRRGLVESAEEWLWSSARAWDSLDTKWPEFDR